MRLHAVCRAWYIACTVLCCANLCCCWALLQLPDRFKSGPLNKLLADLVLLYYATCQGVEGARRTYFRQVSQHHAQ